MSEYYPDKFIIVKVQDIRTDVESNFETYYRVLGTWLGGYLTGDHYRLNSGIERWERIEDGKIRFYGSSGSVYEVGEGSYGTSIWSQSWLAELKEAYKGELELTPITMQEFEEEWNVK